MRHRIRSIAAAFTLFGFAGMACPGIAHAGDCPLPPPNEDCGDEIVFSTDDVPFTFNGQLGCVNDVVDKPYWDVFFRFDCTTSGTYTFDMCDSEWDTYLRIYSDGCGWGDGDELAVDDDGCPGSSPPPADPMLTIDLDAGNSYWIELGTWRPDPPFAQPNSEYVFHVTVDPCDGDTNADSVVDVLDLVGVVLAWGPCGPPCGADLNNSGTVDVVDLLAVILAWGPC